MLGSPGATIDMFAFTPEVSNDISSVSMNVLEFFTHISTPSVPERPRTYAAHPEDLPIPTSPTIISVLLLLGPVKDAIVTVGIVGLPSFDDSNTA